ncbi:HAD-IA family hydrolase [Candidatus Parcubacteria bacterium]|jgi:epoxide hydrolase-like predicted phosphatase|nr:HAD-IA family hydrolase [Candidatus Parcubacteria bacterium]
MIKAIAFDLNGVIITESGYFTHRLEQKYNIPNEDFFNIFSKVIKVARQPGCEDFFKLWQQGLKDLGLSISKEDFFDLWFSGESLVPAFLEYIKTLRKSGLKIFILSNNFKERTTYYRQNFTEIFDSVDQAYFSWETGFVKPDPQAYQNILTKNNLQGNELVYFDDVEENINSASNLGIVARKFEDLDKTKQTIEALIK